ncbi:protein-S-isoprenylcysteine O-methyltransferase [Synchytrium endobioticum]|uniref:Protein-S-isoprenylcysteine O-methyltransferase n=1 Tax=Synchytrium endobioticum TaxID=286115 RepID=A0A507CWJ3_9FUNG|nr:protein-S-isoprenylcysteine O-methyltransferase [Synchytrium endobioticum]
MEISARKPLLEDPYHVQDDINYSFQRPAVSTDATTAGLTKNKGFLGTGLPIFNDEHTPPNVALYSAGCGIIIGIGIMMGLCLAEDGWSGFGFFLAAVAAFHLLEYLPTAMFHPGTVGLNSFLFNHSASFNIAMASSVIEYLIEWKYFPWLKHYRYSTRLGLLITILAQILRTTAMITASSNFTHLIRDQKEATHTLVKHGVYSVLRHPSYTGFFYWGIGLQVMAANPVCLVGYTVALWSFFYNRVQYEEMTLARFFGQDTQMQLELINEKKSVPVQGHSITDNDHDQQLPPLPFPDTVPAQVNPSLLGAITRTVALQAGAIVHFLALNASVFAKGFVRWWFGTPAKLFRPYAINPYQIFYHLAQHEGTRLSPKFLRGVLEKEGLQLLWKNFVPMLVMNSTVGIVLFNVYSLAYSQLLKYNPNKTISPFLAGALGGFAQSLFATPLENIQLLVGKAKILEGRKQGILRVIRDEIRLKIASERFKHGQFRTLYDGWLFTSTRDTTSFALFFGMFETIKTFSQRFIKLNIVGSDNAYRVTEKQVQWMNGFGVVGSGALAGLSHQMVAFPLEKWKSLVLDVPLAQGAEGATAVKVNVSARRKPKWCEWMKVLRQHRVHGLYKGVGAQVWRSAPPSALALFVYELFKENI